MTTTLDSGDQGTPEKAISDGSNSQPNQMGSSGEAKYVTEEVFQSILDQKLESFRRSLQSDKDKGIKKATERIESMEGDLKKVLQLASKGGKSVEDLIAELDAQEEQEARQASIEVARMLREGKFPVASSQGSEQATGVDVSAVLNELELDESDTRVQAFRARQFKSNEELYRESAKLLKQIHTRQPEDSDAPSSEGKRQSVPTNLQALKTEYESRSKGLYGTNLVRLKREMREKGLTV